MDYKRIYVQFITDRRAKEPALLASGDYVERHHIVPRSMGGGDEAENIIALSAGDHFFAHLCLAKAHDGSQWISVHTMSFGADFHKRSELISKRRWFALAREKARNVHAKNTARQHLDPVYRSVMDSEEIQKKRSESMRTHMRTQEGQSHKEKWHAALFSKESIAKRGEATRLSYASGKREADKLRIAKQARSQSNDPAWLAKLPRGKNHPRNTNPEKWAKAVEGMRGDNNPAKRPEIALKIATKKSERDRKRTEYFERSGFTGNRRNVKMTEVDAWFKANPT